MDFAALTLSIEVTRRAARSALPGAPVELPTRRRQRFAAALRRVTHRRGSG